MTKRQRLHTTAVGSTGSEQAASTSAHGIAAIPEHQVQLAFGLLIAILLAASIGTAALAQEVTRSPVRDGSSESVRAWVKAVEAGDLEAIGEMNLASTAAYPVDAMKSVGGTAIALGYASMFAGFKASVNIEDAHYIASGDVLHSWGMFKLTLVPRSGDSKVTVINGRFSDVALKSGGKWRYVMNHASVPYRTQ